MSPRGTRREVSDAPLGRRVRLPPALFTTPPACPQDFPAVQPTLFHAMLLTTARAGKEWGPEPSVRKLKKFSECATLIRMSSANTTVDCNVVKQQSF
jgi:hypothetical protein